MRGASPLPPRARLTQSLTQSLTLALAMGFTATAQAQSAPPASANGPADWVMTLGAAGIYAPVFQGAKDYGLSLFPDLRLRYRDEVFASVPDGLGWNLINTARWKAGPIARIRFGRREDTGGSPFLIAGESNALQGLGDVATAGEAGVFVQYALGFARAQAQLRQGFGGHDGMLGDAGLDYVGRHGALTYSIGPRATYGSARYTHTYFGISPAQSARSGLAPYSAGAGLVSYGIGGSLTLPVRPRIALTLFAGADRLAAQAADSPLVRQRGSRHQAMAGLGLGYRFSWDKSSR